jgi:hypothetical protein
MTHAMTRILIVTTLCCFAAASGCAAIKATQQPEKRDMKVLDQGVSRTRVIGEFGTPQWSDHPSQPTVDVFKFRQGYSKANKATRAVVHVAADVATLGLWEIVGIPAESIANGTEVQVEFHYKADQTVDHIVVLKGDEAVHPPKMFATRPKAAAQPTPVASAPPRAISQPNPVVSTSAELPRR